MTKRLINHAAIIGRKGGQSTASKHGSSHMSKIAKKRWRKEKKLKKQAVDNAEKPSNTGLDDASGRMA